MFGFIRVAAVSTKLFLGNIDANTKHICSLIQSQKEVAVTLFPELCITGYTMGDLFFQEIVHQKVLEALEEIKKCVMDGVVIVGAPLWYKERLYNCAVVMQNQNILGIVPKSYLANYREFYEKRWFSSGKEIKDATLLDAPFGTDLIFRYQDFCFGVEICEDLWTLKPPSFAMAAAGANVIFNLSASDELVGKHAYRKELVKTQSARIVGAYVYASSGVGESSSDLCYSGATIVAENGSILAEGERFVFDDVVTIADIDIEKLKILRRSETSFGDADVQAFREIELSCLPEPKDIRRSYTPHPFVPPKENRDEVCHEIFSIQSSALARRVMHIAKETKLVIGVSGGLDSTLALLVCAKVCELLHKPFTDIVAVSMPGFGTTDATKKSARKLCEALGTTCKEIDITKSVLQHFRDIDHDPNLCDVTYENAQARERTQILMDLANEVCGIVIGTGDLSEIALGFATYNGDHMAMYNVNAGVPKTLVRYVIEWVALRQSHLKQILLDIINRPVSPELLPAKNGNITQKTEDIIGPYELHDFFLYHFLKYGAEPKKIVAIAKIAFEEKYDEKTIKKWLKLFLKRFFANQFKRNAMPDGVKVGTIALSPRGDWRMPSDAKVTIWLNELEDGC
ncbi:MULTISPECIES: NAD(+) synthase [unclassified Nitratiruptor]|uniref:NAD(+) synthase n=1 Tax=unclassified Nitratiruptor TaxID=2624044 RepID=UPI0019156738|nr:MULTISPECIES: NAD(+) synthase [unclassified Nitratiruptor]BCD59837.1 NAD+ synthase (glutamine-hydrolysing) [Nitratiruptor sp. YY08-10]BCD63760.1 NAD+ synthase (glutamine-hydrolysing) [Nitratiruptor sp. YY08-14]